MIARAPYSGMIGPAAAGGGADSPDDISGLLVWFKADAGVFSDAGSTPANNNDTVQQWNDQSGNAIHASQATSGSRPTYRTNQVNGLPAVDFATSKWMAFAQQTVTDVTIFAVVKQGSAAAVKTILGGNANDNTKIKLFFNNYNLKTEQHTVESFEEEPITDFIQVYQRSNGTNTVLRVDEVDTGTPGTAASSLGVSHLGAFLSSGTATGFLNGLIAELILYNGALSDTDRAVVESYLRTKYALPNPAQTLTDPTTITGCKCWLKADAGAYNDAGSTLATDGQTVQQWNDQSGLGNNATQATSGSRPTFQTNEINTSLPVIRFDGSDDWMQVPSFTIGALAVVHKYRTSGNYPNYKAPFNDRTIADGRVFLLESGTTGIRTNANTAMRERHFRNGTKTNNLAPIDSYQISFGSWPGASNIVTDAFDVGRDDQNNARAWDGDIVEIIAYDRGLSPANRKRIQNYLGTKYGITVA